MTRVLVFTSDDDYSLWVEKAFKELKSVLRRRYECDVGIFRVDSPEVALMAMRYGVDELPSVVIDDRVFRPQDVEEVVRQLIRGRDPREIIASDLADSSELRSKAVKIRNFAMISSIDLDSVVPGAEKFLSDVENLSDTISKEKYSQIEEKMRLIEKKISEILSEKGDVERLKEEVEKLTSMCIKKIEDLKSLSEGILPIDNLINEFSSRIRRDLLKECRNSKECLSRGIEELKGLLSEMRAVEEKLEDLREILSGLSVNELESSIILELDDIFNTLIFSEYVRYINSTLIPSLKGEVKIERSEEIDEFFKKLEEYEIASTVIEFFNDMKKTGFPLAELLAYEDPDVSKLFNSLKSLAISRELSRIDAGRAAFRRLYEARRSLESLREMMLESRKFIPIWEKYVLAELQKRKTVSVDELIKIPPKWRRLVISRLVKSGEVIPLPNNKLSYAFTMDSFIQVRESLRDRLERMHQALEKLKSMGVEIPPNLEEELREYLELVRSTEVASDSNKEVLTEIVKRLRDMKSRIAEIERELKSRL